MYKVFINEKALFLSESPINNFKNLEYDSNTIFNTALDFINNYDFINIYYHNLDFLWENFKNQFTIINAAGGLVFNENNEILIIKRLGKWDLPKGKVEANETLEESAIREIEEECGIHNLILENFFYTTYHLYFIKEYILKFTYWYTMKYKGNEELSPQYEENIEEAKWISINNLDDIKENTYGNIKLLLNLYENK